jgi:cell fate regulator YaaT (PSP1 superfamily)
VKDLAATFRTRIELRQIGARDETRRFSGSGPCGRLLCCSSFIEEFCPITTQMAKDQNLPLNPSKISGCCGRLKCCLGYEISLYRNTLRNLPRWDTKLETVKGPATVEKLDVFSGMVTLRYQSGDVEKLDEAGLDKILAPGFKPPKLPEEPCEEEPEQGFFDADEFDFPMNPS